MQDSEILLRSLISPNWPTGCMTTTSLDARVVFRLTFSLWFMYSISNLRILPSRVLRTSEIIPYWYCLSNSFSDLRNKITSPILEMGIYRVLRFEFPASSSPIFEFPASENSATLIEPSSPLAENSANLNQPSSPLSKRFSIFDFWLSYVYDWFSVFGCVCVCLYLCACANFAS